MSTMLFKLWNTTFHLEGKFLRTCWQLFIPAKISLEFFKGKQGRYPHPLRMFAVVMFLFLFTFNHLLKGRDTENSGQLLTMTTRVNTENGDSIVAEKEIPLYEAARNRALLEDLRQDFENMPLSWQTPESRKVVDSLLYKNNLRHGIDDPGLLDSLGTDIDSTTINFFGAEPLKIAAADMVRYDADEIIRRYGVTNWAPKLLVRQTIKSFKNPEGLAHAYIGSLTWAILALVALMSGFLGLLYWRQRRYYVEHFIFLLHFHTGLMLAALLAIIGIMLDVWAGAIFGVVFLWATIAMYIAMRRYYQQNAWKTALKWLIYGFVYYISFAVLFIIGAVLVFAIY